tara:strand:- start:67 stop:261 length:195 start_codon:yes stop_codon:yes gene_type:complete
MTTFSKHSLWLSQASAFNFEHDEDELLALALQRGFVIELNHEPGLYRMNDKYINDYFMTYFELI